MGPKSIDRIFWDAAQITSAGERAAYLDGACSEDVELRRRVEQLLEARTKAEGFLESPAFQLADTIRQPPLGEGAGTAVGPYKLLEQIGEGGFGVVFLAEQQQPVKRKVALKILKPGMDSPQAVARFEAERQALALMDHPHIAKILDGGQTASGRPYLVMELVKGVPITEYCDQSGLSVRERLKLFVAVCRAVQHAHHKGVIHRDLKPSNVLVTRHDATPVVKVIDFGVAKALGQQLTDKALFTGLAQLIGTPLYMSPEQAALGGPDVDTRSDIYALGVLLYELLTGTTPFDWQRLRAADFDEIRRIIREEEPATPSTRLRKDEGGRMKDEAKATKPTGWRRFLPFSSFILHPSSFRELDWIVMKALEKDRTRRYETALGLARDVECYLHDRPVQACPPSALYRFGKFARRNRAALAVAGLVLLTAVSLGGGAAWVVRDRTARSQATGQAVQQALDEAAALQGQAMWPEALEAAKRAQGLLADGGSDELRRRVHELREDLRMVLRLEEIRLPRAAGGVEGAYDNAWADASYAQAFRDYGIDVESLEPAEAARRIGDRTIRLELTVALDHWANKRAKIPEGARDAGRRDWKRLLAVSRVADPDPWRNHLRDALEQRDARALTELAASPKIGDLPLQTLSLLAEHLSAEPAVAVLRLARQQYPDDFWINFQLAWSLDHGPRPPADEVIRFYTVAQALRPRNLPVHMFLGHKLRASGRLDEALLVYRRAAELQKPGDGAAYVWVGDALKDQDKLDEAIAMYRKAVALGEKAPGTEHPGTLAAIYSLALAYREAGQPARAVSLLEGALEKVKAWLGPDDPRTLDTLYRLALAHQYVGRLERAEGLLRELVERRKTDGPQSLAAAEVLATLGWNLLKQQRYTAAEPILRECLAVRAKTAPDHFLTFGTRSMLGGALLGQKKYAEAEPLLLQGYEGMKQREAKAFKEGRPRLTEALERLERLYRETGQNARAGEWARKLRESRATRKKPGPKRGEVTDP
jgi:serine/threonine protein kinase/tetratricopeptide (TPR) repeat protein